MPAVMAFFNEISNQGRCLVAIKFADSQSIKLQNDSTNWLAVTPRSRQQQVKPDDHSEVVPLLPIPNRTVKRLSADDSADSRVKVGHRQASYSNPLHSHGAGFLFSAVFFLPYWPRR